MTKLWVAVLFMTAVTQGQVPRELHSSDTSIRVASGASSPTLVEVNSGQHQWNNSAPEKLIDKVRIAGKILPVHWEFDSAESHSDKGSVVFVYRSETPKLRLSWEWTTRAASGPIEHVIRIQNLEQRELWIPLQDSFRFEFQVPLEEPLYSLYVEKGADTPSLVGTHEVMIKDGYAWEGKSSTYAHPYQNRDREVIPWFAVRSQNGHGWYTGIEFSGRTRLALRRGSKAITGEVGLNPDLGPFWTRLQPSKTFVTPPIFLGAFDGDFDSAGNILRRWEREVLGNPKTWANPKYPVLVNNSWGSGMLVDEALALRMIRDSAELGLEMFHMDAGWFRGVGDWYPDPTKFPRGLSVVADAAHRAGLKFGLWVDWAQAGLSKNPGALNARNPKVNDWLVTDLPPDWKPEEFKGQTIDIGEPAAHDWAQAEVQRIVSDYHLDMLEHDGYLVAYGCFRKDHPHAPPDPTSMGIHKDAGFLFAESANSTDVSYHAVNSYYDIHSKLRESHPDLLLEVCNDGGRMVDFGSAAHADYFSITDTYDPLSNRRAFFDTSHVLPPAMLESYVETWPAPKIENFLYMLRSGMMGWMSVMQDTTKWSPEQHSAAKEEFQLYKDRLRAFIRDGELYHVSERPDGIRWDGIEYFDPHSKSGVLYAFHGSDPSQPRHVFLLRGLQETANYTLAFHDKSSGDVTMSGRELMTNGLSMSLPVPNSSELVFISQVE